MHAEEDDLFYIKHDNIKQEGYGFDEDDDSIMSPAKRRRRLSE